MRLETTTMCSRHCCLQQMKYICRANVRACLRPSPGALHNIAVFNLGRGCYIVKLARRGSCSHVPHFSLQLSLSVDSPRSFAVYVIAASPTTLEVMSYVFPCKTDNTQGSCFRVQCLPHSSVWLWRSLTSFVRATRPRCLFISALSLHTYPTLARISAGTFGSP